MFEAFLVTTSSEGLRALGMREQRSYELISDSVRERLGDRHAALFGEPVATAHGDHYDWYSPVAGKAAKLTSLDETRQAEARAVLAELTADIRAEAQRLGGSRSLDDLRLGEALDNALQVPGDDDIYVVERQDDGKSVLQPVLVNWAWVGDQQRAVRGVLTGADNREAVPAKERAAAAGAAGEPAGGLPPQAAVLDEPAAGRRDRGAWMRWLLGLGWLLLAVMIVAIVALLVRPCALSGLTGLSFCPPPPQIALAATARTLELENQIAQIERQIAEADRACQPPPPPPLPAPIAAPVPEPVAEAAPPVDSDLQDRLDRAGATLGQLTFSLAWDSVADLDLEVTCPTGGKVWYGDRNVCGGQLDVDGNQNLTTARRDPVENIYYQAPSPGSYQVRVLLYALQGAGPTQPFRLQVRDGQQTQVLEGVVSSAGPAWTTTYEAGNR